MIAHRYLNLRTNRPSGVLYAAMMSVFRGIDTYESMLALLIRSNCITRVSHILRAI